MAYAKIESKSSNAGTPSIALSFTALPVVGSLIVVAQTRNGAAPTAPSDNQSNTYTQIGSTITVNNNGASGFLQLFYSIVTTSSGTFTITSGGAPTMAIYNFSGGATSSILDTSLSATGSSTSPASGNVTPVNNGSLIFVAELDTDTTNSANTAGTDFTLDQQQLDNASHERIACEFYIQPTAAAHNGNMTIVSAPWAIITAVFKPLPSAFNAKKSSAFLTFF